MSDTSTNLVQNSIIAAAIKTSLDDSKTYTDEQVAAMTTFSIKVVDTLPAVDVNEHTMYLVPKASNGATDDLFDEYIYVNSKYEHIGVTSIDLSDQALKSEIPIDYAKNKVLSTIEEVNDANLESGIYSVENVDMVFPYGGESGTVNRYFMLIVNKHRQQDNFGSQIAIPYFEGQQHGVYYRLANAGTWSDWVSLADGGNASTVDNKHAADIYVSEKQCFAADETILDWVNKTNSNATRGIMAPNYPSDAPVQGEGTVSISLLDYGDRKTVIFKGYSTNDVYIRHVYQSAWGVDWQKINSKDADTLDSLHAADFQRFYNLNGVETSVLAPLSTGLYFNQYWTDYPLDVKDSQGMVIVINYSSTQVAHAWTRRFFITPHSDRTQVNSMINSNWTGWSKITTDKEINNPNLLINSNFVINQRGQTEYTTHVDPQYTVDRWRAQRSGNSCSYSVKIGSNNEITLAASGEGYMDFTQPFENHFTNGLYTLSVGIDGEIETVSGVLTGNNTVNTTRIGFNKKGVFIRTQAGSTHTVYWAKFERGQRSEYSQDADSTTEILKCQKYFVRLQADPIYGKYGYIGSGTIDSATQASVDISLPVVMRNKTPTITMSNPPCNIVTVSRPATNPIIPTRALLDSSMVGTNLNIIFNASGGTIGEHCRLQFRHTDNSYLDFDAEIY